MDTQANPIPRLGDRNIYCPYYSDCLDHVIKCSWHSWSCLQCPHKARQSFTECNYDVGDQEQSPYVPPHIIRAIDNDLFDW